MPGSEKTNSTNSEGSSVKENNRARSRSSSSAYTSEDETSKYDGDDEGGGASRAEKNDGPRKRASSEPIIPTKFVEKVENKKRRYSEGDTPFHLNLPEESEEETLSNSGSFFLSNNNEEEEASNTIANMDYATLIAVLIWKGNDRKPPSDEEELSNNHKSIPDAKTIHEDLKHILGEEDAKYIYKATQEEAFGFVKIPEDLIPSPKKGESLATAAAEKAYNIIKDAAMSAKNKQELTSDDERFGAGVTRDSKKVTLSTGIPAPGQEVTLAITFARTPDRKRNMPAKDAQYIMAKYNADGQLIDLILPPGIDMTKEPPTIKVGEQTYYSNVDAKNILDLQGRLDRNQKEYSEALGYREEVPRSYMTSKEELDKLPKRIGNLTDEDNHNRKGLQHYIKEVKELKKYKEAAEAKRAERNGEEVPERENFLEKDRKLLKSLKKLVKENRESNELVDELLARKEGTASVTRERQSQSSSEDTGSPDPTNSHDEGSINSTPPSPPLSPSTPRERSSTVGSDDSDTIPAITSTGTQPPEEANLKGEDSKTPPHRHLTPTTGRSAFSPIRVDTATPPLSNTLVDNATPSSQVNLRIQTTPFSTNDTSKYPESQDSNQHTPLRLLLITPRIFHADLLNPTTTEETNMENARKVQLYIQRTEPTDRNPLQDAYVLGSSKVFQTVIYRALAENDRMGLLEHFAENNPVTTKDKGEKDNILEKAKEELHTKLMEIAKKRGLKAAMGFNTGTQDDDPRTPSPKNKSGVHTITTSKEFLKFVLKDSPTDDLIYTRCKKANTIEKETLKRILTELAPSDEASSCNVFVKSLIAAQEKTPPIFDQKEFRTLVNLSNKTITSKILFDIELKQNLKAREETRNAEPPPPPKISPDSTPTTSPRSTSTRKRGTRGFGG